MLLESESFYLNIANSDYFFNFGFGVKDEKVLAKGAKVLDIKGEICERESSQHSTTLSNTHIRKQLADTYPAYPLHGLLGQTWRNAVYCGRYYEGTVDDYVTGDLFGNSHTFNYFNQ
jgi:hypothetical protein